MKYIIIAILILCQYTAFSQYEIVVVAEARDTINFSHLRGHAQHYVDGKRIHYEDETIILEVWQKNGRMNGLFIAYYSTGEVYFRMIVVSDIP